MEQKDRERRVSAAAGSSATVLEFPAAVVSRAQEDDVERINQFTFYEIGQRLKALSVREGEIRPDFALLMELLAAQNTIEELLKDKPLPISVSRPAAMALCEAVRNVIRPHYYRQNEAGETAFAFPADDAKPLEVWQWNLVKTAIGTFETVLRAELEAIATYFVPRRGIYWTPALVDSADESFPKHLLGHISDKTREDWRAAGRCLAFHLLSASGFHVARAVEGQIELYYQLFTGKPGATLKSWHEYAKEIKDIAAANPKPAPSAKTLAEFTQMKDDYRNPIMHPRVSLKESDARMLFDNGESLIIAMAEEIAAIREAGGVQGTFQVIANTGASP
jgi:hypothetical protein